MGGGGGGGGGGDGDGGVNGRGGGGGGGGVGMVWRGGSTFVNTTVPNFLFGKGVPYQFGAQWGGGAMYGGKKGPLRASADSRLAGWSTSETAAHTRRGWTIRWMADGKNGRRTQSSESSHSNLKFSIIIAKQGHGAALCGESCATPRQVSGGEVAERQPWPAARPRGPVAADGRETWLGDTKIDTEERWPEGLHRSGLRWRRRRHTPNAEPADRAWR